MTNQLNGMSKRRPSFTKVRAVCGLLAVAGLALSVSGLPSSAPADAASATKATALTDAEVNGKLDQLAKKLAVAVKDAGVRSVIHGAIEKRFDGDEDALWSSLAVDSKFTNKIAVTPEARNQVAQTALDLPRLQVSVPVHFDSWNSAQYEPLVAFFPEGVDDTTIKTITAYDSTGKAVQLDAQVEPKRPVIVVDLNERTDEAGKLVRQQAESSTKPSTATSIQSVAAAPAKYTVTMQVVNLIDDKEPWSKGDAEIALKARSRGCSGVDYTEGNWPGLNDSGDGWSDGRNLGLTTCDVVFYWWEDDSGAFDFTLGLGGFSLGVHMSDEDDLIGGKQLAYSTFKGSSLNLTQWSALAQSTM